MTDLALRAGRVGRPARPPEGESAVVALIAWLNEQMDADPRISRADLAKLVPSVKSRSGHAAQSTITQWLSGAKSPPDLLIAAMVEARSAHLTAGERLAFDRNLADLRADVEASERLARAAAMRNFNPAAVRASKNNDAVVAKLQGLSDEVSRLRIERDRQKQLKQNAEAERAGLFEQIGKLEHERDDAQAGFTRATAEINAVRLEHVQLRGDYEALVTAREGPEQYEGTGDPELEELEQRRQALLNSCTALEMEHRRLVEAEMLKRQVLAESVARVRREDEFAYRERVSKKARMQTELVRLEAQRRAEEDALNKLRRQRAQLEAELVRLGLSLSDMGVVSDVFADAPDLATAIGSSADPIFLQLQQETAPGLPDYVDLSYQDEPTIEIFPWYEYSGNPHDNFGPESHGYAGGGDGGLASYASGGEGSPTWSSKPYGYNADATSPERLSDLMQPRSEPPEAGLSPSALLYEHYVSGDGIDLAVQTEPDAQYKGRHKQPYES